MTPRNVLLTMS